MTTVTVIKRYHIDRVDEWDSKDMLEKADIKSGCFKVKKCALYFTEGGKKSHHMEIFSYTWKCLTWRLRWTYSHLTHAKNTFTAWELRVKNADFTDKNLSLNGIRQ